MSRVSLTCRLYLVLDHAEPDRTAQFVRTSRLPAAFVRCTTGYHHLDADELDGAIAQLASPAVVPEFLSAIIASLSVSPRHLVDFVALTRPTVVAAEDVAAVVEALVMEGRTQQALEWVRRSAPVPTSSARTDGIRGLLTAAFSASRERIAALTV